MYKPQLLLTGHFSICFSIFSTTLPMLHMITQQRDTSSRPGQNIARNLIFFFVEENSEDTMFGGGSLGSNDHPWSQVMKINYIVRMHGLITCKSSRLTAK